MDYRTATIPLFSFVAVSDLHITPKFAEVLLQSLTQPGEGSKEEMRRFI
ncbi:MAG: hypothetical protein IJD86_04500 [Clostridia bacterium]|nr:hypothetical protein [Clostridia bacterium]